MLALLGERASAVEHLQKGVTLAPSTATNWVNLAKYEAAEKRWADAVEHARKALALEPEVADGLNTLVYSLTSAGRQAEAKDELSGWVRRQPESVEGHRLLGMLFAQSAQFRRGEGGSSPRPCVVTQPTLTSRRCSPNAKRS